jgi:hypothetical protein
MKVHSLEGLKQKARNYTCTVVCDMDAQKVQGVTVIVETTPITCLYDRATDYYLWIVCGQFAHEDDVRAFLDEGKPDYSKVTTPCEALKKFDAYRSTLLPALATHVQTEGREAYETICRLSEAWGVQYHGPEGYTRITDMLTRGGGAVPQNVLAQKADSAEAALLGVAEHFMAECKRLELN